MYRITTFALTSRAIVHRYCNPVELQSASISRFPSKKYKYQDPKERDTCLPPPPPPPPPPRDDRLFWGTMAALVLTGGFAVYAKQSPQVRDWLSMQYPWFDDLIAMMYQENMTYKELIGHFAEQFKKSLTNYFSDEKPKQCSSDGTPIPSIKDSETTLASVTEGDGEDEDEEGPCEILPPPVMTKDICEMQRCLKDLGDGAIHNLWTAKDACTYYNTLMEKVMRDFDMKSWGQLRPALAERENLVKESIKNADDARKRLNELTRYIECGMPVPPGQLEEMRQLLKDYQERIRAMEIQYQWENEKAEVWDRHLSIMEAMVNRYVGETKAMFGLDYEAEKPALTGDPDLLLHHTLRYVQVLREQLKSGIASMSERANRAVQLKESECDPSSAKNLEQAKKARQNAIQSLYAKKKAELDKEFKKRYDDQKAANDKYLKDEMNKQLQKHEELLCCRLAIKENDSCIKLNQMVNDAVAAEKDKFAKELTAMRGKLQLVEDKLNAKLKAERETRRSQELWAAGSSLLAATKKGANNIRVDKEINAIERATGDGDQLVLSVLKAIPPSVREKGVVPESVLKEKYHSMERTALRVALVEQEGGPLAVYWLSLLQSTLLFMKISGIPQGEYDNPPKEPSKDLDTFDLLQRARFWMERGNVAAAVRYVSQLQGASRAAAATWFEAARSHLEIKQAAEAVLAHATALGLQYI